MTGREHGDMAPSAPCPECGWQRPPCLWIWQPNPAQAAVTCCYDCWAVRATPGANCATDVGGTCLNGDCACHPQRAAA